MRGRKAKVYCICEGEKSESFVTAFHCVPHYFTRQFMHAVVLTCIIFYQLYNYFIVVCSRPMQFKKTLRTLCQIAVTF